MNNNDLSIIESDDTFNLSEIEDTNSFHVLRSFVKEFAPNYVPTMDKVLRSEDVKTADIRKILDVMVEVMMPYYEPHGVITNTKMAQLHEAMVGVGRQL